MNVEQRFSLLENRLAALEKHVESSTRPMMELDIIGSRLNRHAAAMADELSRVHLAIHEMRQWFQSYKESGL